jgi:hypothetical protein
MKSKMNVNADVNHRPQSWQSNDLAFSCPTFGGTILPSAMSRHFLVLGETGSGKTCSVVEPLTVSCASYRADQPDCRAAMLVIDPKMELGDVLLGSLGLQAKDRLVSLSTYKKKYRIDYFEGVDRRQLSGKAIIESLCEYAPEFQRSLTQGGNNVMWSKRTEGFLASLIDIDLTIRRKLEDKGESKDFFRQLAEELQRTIFNDSTLTPDRPPGALLMSIASDLADGRLGYVRDNYFDGFQEFVGVAMRLSNKPTHDASLSTQDVFWSACIAVARNAGVSPQNYLSLQEFTGLYPEAYISILSLANSLLNDLSAPEFVDFVSLNPFEQPSNSLSVLQAIEDGKVLVYTPDTANISAVNVGKALKAKFFEFTFKRHNKERPVIYICDEFQHFITGDSVSGEQSFLDRCRAYRGICVLASQSLNALRFRLRSLDPQGPADDALNSLINNTGNKFFFRNTDIDTIERVRNLLPNPPVLNRPHIADVRPLSTLGVGECYFLLSDGSWGRRKLALPGSKETDAG